MKDRIVDSKGWRWWMIAVFGAQYVSYTGEITMIVTLYTRPVCPNFFVNFNKEAGYRNSCCKRERGFLKRKANYTPW